MQAYSRFIGKASQDQQTLVQSLNAFLDQLDPELRTRFEILKDILLSMGNDVQLLVLRHYVAFTHPANFACVEIRVASNSLVVYLKCNPQSITFGTGFARDVSKVGHNGTGNVELTIRSDKDLEEAKPLLRESYNLTANPRYLGNRKNHPLTISL